MPCSNSWIFGAGGAVFMAIGFLAGFYSLVRIAIKQNRQLDRTLTSMIISYPGITTYMLWTNAGGDASLGTVYARLNRLRDMGIVVSTSVPGGVERVYRPQLQWRMVPIPKAGE